QRFDAACLQPYMFADHIVVAHAARQAPAAIALEMEDLASLLDEVVQHPLLTIPRQPGSAAYSVLWTCHGCDPPSSKYWLASSGGAQSEPLQPGQDGFGKIR